MERCDKKTSRTCCFAKYRYIYCSASKRLRPIDKFARVRLCPCFFFHAKEERLFFISFSPLAPLLRIAFYDAFENSLLIRACVSESIVEKCALNTNEGCMYAQTSVGGNNGGAAHWLSIILTSFLYERLFLDWYATVQRSVGHTPFTASSKFSKSSGEVGLEGVVAHTNAVYLCVEDLMERKQSRFLEV